MTERDEQRLRQRFEALRREDVAGVTPFRALLAANPTRPGRFVLRWAAAGTAVAVVLVAVAVLLMTRNQRGDAVDLATVRWEGPTDFLLRVPGEELLWAVPRLGVLPDVRLN